jgi:hypothetical protein
MLTGTGGIVNVSFQSANVLIGHLAAQERIRMA